MKVDFYDKQGKKKATKFDLSDELFPEKVNMELISRYIYVYLSNQRQGNAQVKGKGDVSGGGRKPWKQKGTGRARHGSNRSPIWRGGGITFGPTGDQNYNKSMPKKMIKKAFSGSLKLKLDGEKLFVTEMPNILKTKEAVAYLESLDKDYRKVLIVQPDEGNMHYYFKNVKNSSVVRVGEVNTYDIMNSNLVVLCDSVVESIQSKCIS